MRYSLGRLLQLAGLIILPIGVAGNVAKPDEVDLKQSLAIASVGAVVFVAGYLIQGKAPPPG